METAGRGLGLIPVLGWKRWKLLQHRLSSQLWGGFSIFPKPLHLSHSHVSQTVTVDEHKIEFFQSEPGFRFRAYL